MLRLAGVFDLDKVPEAIRGLTDVELVQLEADALLLTLEGASTRLPEIFEVLASAGAEVRETTMNQPSLESLFIKITGRELRQ